MKTLTKESAKKFLGRNPTQLARYLNQLGQCVRIFEHPELGDDACVYAEIGGYVANTHSYDSRDFVTTMRNIVEPTEYMPVLVGDKINSAMEFGVD